MEDHVQLNMVLHVRHRAHVPITDGLIEGIGKLHRSEGRAARVE